MQIFQDLSSLLGFCRGMSGKLSDQGVENSPYSLNYKLWNDLSYIHVVHCTQVAFGAGQVHILVFHNMHVVILLYIKV